MCYAVCVCVCGRQTFKMFEDECTHHCINQYEESQANVRENKCGELETETEFLSHFAAASVGCQRVFVEFRVGLECSSIIAA